MTSRNESIRKMSHADACLYCTVFGFDRPLVKRPSFFGAGGETRTLKPVKA